MDVEAVLRIFQFKGRPLTDPLIVHVPDTASARRLLALPSAGSEAVFNALCAAFWPGPLTIVARGIPAIPDKVMASTGFVGVRVPANPIAQRLLQEAGVPVAAPSANRFGHVSPTRASHVVADLGQHPIGILLSEREANASESSDGLPDGGGGRPPSATTMLSDAAGATAAVGIESTVAKLVDDASSCRGSASADGCSESQVKVLVLRRGGVSVQQLRDCLDKAGLRHVQVEVAQLSKPDAAAQSPAALLAAPFVDSSSPASQQQPASQLESTASADAAGMEAPGMLLTHYAPDVDTYLVTSVADVGDQKPPQQCSVYGDDASAAAAAVAASCCSGTDGDRGVIKHISDGAQLTLPFASSVVIDFGGMMASLRSRCLAYEDMSTAGSVTEARQRVFDVLRWAETVAGAMAILLADPLMRASGATDELQHIDALRDRMYRASSGKEVALHL